MNQYRARPLPQVAPVGTPEDQCAPTATDDVPSLLRDLRGQMTQMVALLTAVKEWTDRRRPEGRVFGTRFQGLTSLDGREYILPRPASVVSFVNEGPNTIQFRIPNDANGSLITLLSNEVMTFSWDYAVVSSTLVKVTQQGDTATVRIIALS